MNININKIIKPWYFAGFSTILLLIVSIFFVINVALNKKYNRMSLDNYLYFKTQISESSLITENEKLLKYTDFYYKIIGWYGNKHQQGGMSKEQKTQFVINSFNYEKWLDLPNFYFVIKAKIETSFTPKGKGALGEMGIFQQMPTADVIGVAYFELNRLRVEKPWLAKKLEFYYKNPDDLYNPLNALNIEALLASYNKYLFEDELVYWISAVHWGAGRIWQFFRNKLKPIYKDFNFKSKKTAEEYSRNPLMYYYVWAEHYNAFINFRKDVNVEQPWIDEYKKQCSKEEKQFLEAYKFYQKAMDLYEEVQIELEDVTQLKLKYYDLMKKGDKYNKLLLKKLKNNEYKNVIKDIFIPGIIYFKSIMEEISKDSKDRFHKQLAIIQLSVIIIVILWAVFGVIVFFILMFKKIRSKVSSAV